MSFHDGYVMSNIINICDMYNCYVESCDILTKSENHHQELRHNYANGAL
jgi:hypothetical protein